MSPSSSHAWSAFSFRAHDYKHLTTPEFKMRTLNTAAIAFCFLTSAALAANPEGNWLSADGGTKVRISTCGGNKLCATLVWLDHPTDPATGRPKTDRLNPDPAKRSRPLIGLQVVNALAPSGPNTWSGRIYNRRRPHLQSPAQGRERRRRQSARLRSRRALQNPHLEADELSSRIRAAPQGGLVEGVANTPLVPAKAGTQGNRVRVPDSGFRLSRE